MEQKMYIRRWPADIVEGIRALAKLHNRKMTDELRAIVQRELTAALPELTTPRPDVTVEQAQEIERLANK